MKQLLDGLMGDARALLQTATGVMAIWFVVWTWVRTRSAVPVIGAIVLGATVSWGVINIDDVEKEVGEDIDRNRKGTNRDASFVPLTEDFTIVWPADVPG